MTKNKKITVTKTFLPSQEDYNLFLKRAWEKSWITNRGELVIELENKIKDYLNVQNILITNNGTIPIQIALQLLANKGEVITTPFSYVATTSSIIWQNCKAVFVDIHPKYLTIDETKIEKAITNNTTAILATHVFGNPCNIPVLEKIAKKHKIKIIYDAAHCFGVRYEGASIFNYGDVSTCSFHATKIFHTGEGGAIFCNDDELFHKLYYSHNFGHNGPLEFHGLGINGKISELQSAMGLAIIPYMDYIISERKKIVELYNSALEDTDLQLLKIRKGTSWNYSYYPIIFKNQEELLKVEKVLYESDIIPRRYFYPSLNTLPYMKYVKMSISESISSRILCLPLYVGLEVKDINKIINIIKSNIK